MTTTINPIFLRRPLNHIIPIQTLELNQNCNLNLKFFYILVLARPINNFLQIQQPLQQFNMNQRTFNAENGIFF